MALGVSSRQTTYKYKGRESRADFASIALLELMEAEERPDTVLCLVTEDARKKTWPIFSKELERMGLTAHPLDISDGDSAEELNKILVKVARAIERESRLTIDITHGPRHIPIVMYVLAIYLTSLQEVQLNGAWYGKLESRSEEKPLISLKPLLDLPLWFHAVRTFRDTGFTSALARRFKQVKNSLPYDSSRQKARWMHDSLRTFSTNFEAGFPLELGEAAGLLNNLLGDHRFEEIPGLKLPLANELGDKMKEVVEPLCFGGDLNGAKRCKKNWKAGIELTANEIKRQANLVDRYLEHEQNTIALGLMREWVVSLGVFHHGNKDKWLDRNERQKSERALSALVNELKRGDGLGSAREISQKEWGGFWNRLREQRNQIAHNGMTVNQSKICLDGIQTFWEQIKGGDSCWPPPRGGGGGKLLVTAVGTAPGVLYSALKKVDPDFALVICTEKTRPGAREAVERAGFKGAVHYLEMRDPFSGFDEIEQIKKQAWPILMDADKVKFNLTGGTTLMGVTVQSLVEQCQKDQIPGYRLLLVDRRPHDEQISQPWVASEQYWLDERPDAEGRGLREPSPV